MEREITFINLSGDQAISTEKIPGVLYKGIQYYDFKDFKFINNAGLANLISLLKNLLNKGVEVRFINVNDKIKNKIKAMGLEHILHCEEK